MTTNVDPDVRVEFILHLRAQTALHLGAAADDLVADLALARDGCGRCYVPGTSWGGVLRQLARRLFSENDAAAAFGPDPTTKDPGYASRVVVDDTPIESASTDGTAPTELRTGVGIDRVTGAAADRVRYDHEVIAPGSTVTLRLRYEGPDDDSVALLRWLVGVVRGNGIRVGAATRRGLGQLSCERAEERVVDLRSRAALLDELAGTLPATAVPPEVAGLETLRILLAWRTTRPVVVGGSAPGDSADLVPLLTRSRGGAGLVPVLPGSAVKGVLRSTAERVLRTVLDERDRPDSDFVTSLDRAAQAVPALEALFGSRSRAGAVAVPDTSANVPPVPAEQWADYLAAGSAPSWGAERTHVAIDRWTGGAAAEQLFTVQETSGVRWPPLTVEVDMEFLRVALPEETERRAAVVLLGLAVGELVEGTAGLGGRTTRGLGDVEVTGVDVEAPAGFPIWAETPGANLSQRWWQWLARTAPDGGWVAALSRKEVS